MGSPEYSVYKSIFSNYNRNVRPHTATAIDVTVALRFFTLLFMEQKEELIMFSADFELSWVDPSLTWSPDEFDGRKDIHVAEAFVWRPDVTVYNSVAQQDVLDSSRRLVTIKSSGNVLLSNPSVYTSRCKLNVNRFPFDTQTCSVRLSSWVYTSEELAIGAPTDAFNYSSPVYKGNSEWDVMSVTVKEVTTQDTDDDQFRELEYQIKLKRRSSYYVFVLFVPTFIVSTLALVGLFTPFDNQGNRVERVTLGLTTLLSLSVMLNIVGNDMPKSDKLPQLGSFVLAEIILCSIGVLVTIVLQLAHQRITTRRILLPREQKGSPGLRVLPPSTPFSSVLGELEVTLKSITSYLDHLDELEQLRLSWLRLFDTLDLFLLILFQIINITMTLCFIFIR